jgi:histidinol-phosphatase (PHP family)
MIQHDYHMHSEFSADSRSPMAAQCERAIELGLREICLTEHADFVPLDETAGFYRPDDYFAELARCREAYGDRLTIRAGVEIGEWHQYDAEASALANSYPYDFIIGSLHWVRGELVLDPSYFADKSETDAYLAYFEELLAMVRHGGFDVIGHLDVPKRAGFAHFGRFESSEWEEPIRAILHAAIEKGIGIEINTGTARRSVAEPGPTVDVLRWYRELGGEILTIGSDAHRPDHLAYAFDRVPAMLAAAGITRITNFEGRKPVSVRVTGDG